MLKSKFKEVTALISLQSNVFSNYFSELMAKHNIKSIRSGLKVLIFYWYFEIISSTMSEPGVTFRPIVAVIVLFIYIVFFISTINTNEPSIMIKISSTLVILCMTYTVIIATDRREIMETHYSLSIIVILMMYTLFHFKFLITMVLSMAYILIFFSVCNYRKQYISKVNETLRDESPLNLERAISHSDAMPSTFIYVQCIFFFLIYLVGIYLRFFNSIRRKSAFLKLTQSAVAQMKYNSAMKSQALWIDAIMPRVVRDAFLNDKYSTDAFTLMYSKRFENVSILFADIVGFNEMYSNKSAYEFISLLHDLYQRFDDLSKDVNCEKIGVVNGSYYCISGCPTPRVNHAISCVEMGLGICRIMKEFNKENDLNFENLIGVHSGKATGVVIGNHRFRFDIFSNDVTLTKVLKQSSRPGFVRISEDTYRLVNYAYSFEEGNLLEIRKEEEHGIGGVFRKIVEVKTYFVIPNSDSKKRMFQPVDDNLSTYKSDINDLHSNQQNSMIENDDKFDEDLKIIRFLQRDPDKPFDIIQNPPLNPIFLNFYDKEIEIQYITHTVDHVQEFTIDSIKTALLFDSLASLLFTTAFLLTVCVAVPKSISIELWSVLIYCSGVILTLVAAFISLVYESTLKYCILRGLYRFCSHPISRSFLSIFISSLPSLFALSWYKPKLMHQSYSYASAYFTFTLFSLIGNTLATTSYSTIKHISTILLTIITSVLMFRRFSSRSLNIHDNCLDDLVKEQKQQTYRYRISYHFIFQLIHIGLLIYYLTRENEKNMRIHFYAAREAEIREAEATRANKRAERFLLNIFPKHVLSKILLSKFEENENMSLTFAQDVSRAGVIVVSVSNFFAKYYREDYKQGESALKVLHTIICIFDNLLQKPVYSGLEKIKTVNDCYIVASGLNANKNDKENDDHLINLMNFALDIHHKLNTFNKNNIFTYSAFTLKIGYNIGAVSAGIVGSSKPLYDIWGDTVNIANRLYITAPINNIQVTSYVFEVLKSKFEFKPRGKISIKNKKDTTTYLVVRSYRNVHLFIKKATKDRASTQTI